jgi:Phospholipid methyltransferase
MQPGTRLGPYEVVAPLGAGGTGEAYRACDTHLGHPLARACIGGPYHFLRNPMYSVGQLQRYGPALLYGSLPGFVAAAAGHLLIYAFYVVAERPLVRSKYIMMPRPTQMIKSGA